MDSSKAEAMVQRQLQGRGGGERPHKGRGDGQRQLQGRGGGEGPLQGRGDGQRQLQGRGGGERHSKAVQWRASWWPSNSARRGDLVGGPLHHVARRPGWWTSPSCSSGSCRWSHRDKFGQCMLLSNLCGPTFRWVHFCTHTACIPW